MYGTDAATPLAAIAAIGPTHARQARPRTVKRGAFFKLAVHEANICLSRLPRAVYWLSGAGGNFAPMIREETELEPLNYHTIEHKEILFV